MPVLAMPGFLERSGPDILVWRAGPTFLWHQATESLAANDPTPFDLPRHSFLIRERVSVPELLPQLPSDYLEFLKTHSGENSYTYDDLDSWWLSTEKELLQTVNVDGKKRPSIYQLASVVESLKKHGEGDAVPDQDGEEFSLDRLAGGLAIGDNNGDTLFLDPSDGFSVWLFHHDGCDVERLAGSFGEWIREAELD